MRNIRNQNRSKGGSAIKLRTLLGLGLAAVAVLTIAGSALAAPGADAVKPRTQSRSGRVDVFFEPVNGKTHYKIYRHERSTATPNSNSPAFSAANADTSFTIVGEAQLSNSTGEWQIVSQSVYHTGDSFDLVQPDANSSLYVVFTDTNVTDWREYYYLVVADSTGSATYNHDPENYIIVSAFPPNQTRHGSYTEFTGACTGCHGLHSAQSQQKLLKGPTATDLCATCHDGSVSKYDEVRGRVFVGSSTHAPAPAGPFGQQLQGTAPSGVQPLSGGSFPSAPNWPGNGGLDWASSVHNVMRQNGPVYAYIYQAPGSGFTTSSKPNDVASAGSGADTAPIGWQNQFSCVSCHEPHNKFDNFRLLRNDINDKRNGDSVVTKATSGGTYNSSTQTTSFSVESVDGLAPGDWIYVGGTFAKIASVASPNVAVQGWVSTVSAGEKVSKVTPPIPIRGLSEIGSTVKGKERWPLAYTYVNGSTSGPNVGDTVYFSQTKFLANTARFCSQCHRAFYNKNVRAVDDRVISRHYTFMSSAPAIGGSDDQAIRQYFRALAAVGINDSSLPSKPSAVDTYCAGSCHGLVYVNNAVEQTVFAGGANQGNVYVGWTTGNRALDEKAGAAMSNVPGSGHRHPTQVPANRVMESGKVIDGPPGAFNVLGVIESGFSQKRVKPGPVNVGLPLEGVNETLDSSNLQTDYTHNDVVCLSCHMAHGSRTGVGTTGSDGNWLANNSVNGDPTYLVGDYKVASAYGQNGALNGTDQANLVLFGYYYVQDSSGPGGASNRKGVSTVLARMEPMASVCYRCHSVK